MGKANRVVQKIQKHREYGQRSWGWVDYQGACRQQRSQKDRDWSLKQRIVFVFALPLLLLSSISLCKDVFSVILAPHVRDDSSFWLELGSHTSIIIWIFWCLLPSSKFALTFQTNLILYLFPRLFSTQGCPFLSVRSWHLPLCLPSFSPDSSCTQDVSFSHSLLLTSVSTADWQAFSQFGSVFPFR